MRALITCCALALLALGVVGCSHHYEGYGYDDGYSYGYDEYRPRHVHRVHRHGGHHYRDDHRGHHYGHHRARRHDHDRHDHRDHHGHDHRGGHR